MSTEITLCISDTGELSVKAGEAPETPAQESAEGGTSHPVQNIETALQMIKQLAAAAMSQPDSEDAQDQGNDEQTEANAMSQSFQPNRSQGKGMMGKGM